MHIARIGVDWAKQVFQFMAWTERRRYSYAGNCADIADTGLFQQTDIVPDWHGSMQEWALPGARTEQAGS